MARSLYRTARAINATRSMSLNRRVMSVSKLRLITDAAVSLAFALSGELTARGTYLDPSLAAPATALGSTAQESHSTKRLLGMRRCRHGDRRLRGAPGERRGFRVDDYSRGTSLHAQRLRSWHGCF